MSEDFPQSVVFGNFELTEGVVLLLVAAATTLWCDRDVFLTLAGPPLHGLWFSRREGGGGGGGSDKGLPLLLARCCEG